MKGLVYSASNVFFCFVSCIAEILEQVLEDQLRVSAVAWEVFEWARETFGLCQDWC